MPGHAVVKSFPKMERPFTATKFGVPNNAAIDWKLITGAGVFGVGWGITSLCPGSVLLLAITGLSGLIYQWLPAFYVGNRIAEAVKGEAK